MSNSDIENKVYFGVHSEKSVVTDMLTKPIWIDNFVTALKNGFVMFRDVKCRHKYIEICLHFTLKKRLHLVV